MYKNIGRKIKTLAKVICGIGIAGSVCLDALFPCEMCRY